jgi:hypothetical protein
MMKISFPMAFHRLDDRGVITLDFQPRQSRQGPDLVPAEGKSVRAQVASTARLCSLDSVKTLLLPTKMALRDSSGLGIPE